MDIKIGKSARSCTACDRTFKHEEAIQSIVRRDTDELVREDFCAGCWDSERGNETYSAWTSQFYDPDAVAQGADEVFSPLRGLFYESVESDERIAKSMAYLAAQLLRRQKVFRLIKETVDPETEHALILFTDRIGNRLIEVQDPSLSHAELDEGRRALQQRLNEIESPDESDDAAPTESEAEDVEGEDHGQDPATSPEAQVAS